MTPKLLARIFSVGYESKCWLNGNKAAKKTVKVDDNFCFLKSMAGAKGLEPSASCVTGKRYNQLNYAPEPRDKIVSNIW